MGKRTTHERPERRAPFWGALISVHFCGDFFRRSFFTVWRKIAKKKIVHFKERPEKRAPLGSLFFRSIFVIVFAMNQAYCDLGIKSDPENTTSGRRATYGRSSRRGKKSPGGSDFFFRERPWVALFLIYGTLKHFIFILKAHYPQKSHMRRTKTNGTNLFTSS